MMKIVEQTSTQLTLKDSVKSAWGLRFVCTPFFILGCIGILLVITEGVFPSFFILFCIFVGTYGVFFTTVKTVILDREQNKITIKSEKLFRGRTREYPLSGMNVRAKETPFRVTTYSSLFIMKKEPIYIVLLEIPYSSRNIKLSGNHSMTRNQAMELVSLIRTFIITDY